MIPFTLWPSLYDIHSFTPMAMDWAALTSSGEFAHKEYKAKDQAPGFGPYVLKDILNTPCPKNGLVTPHRCDAAVEAMTMAVFDADEGDTQPAQDKLAAAGVAAYWYTTYSHREDKGAWRLLIPLAAPLAPAAWPAVRRHLLQRFSIPANPNKCGGVSHFYYLPSVAPGGYADAFPQTGSPLDVTALAAVATKAAAAKAPITVEVPADPAEPVDMRPIREALTRKHRSLRSSKDAKDQRRAHWFGNMLEGKALDDKGRRNDAMVSVTGTIVCTLPDNPPPSVVWHLVKPSWEAMVAAGSSMTQAEVEDMIQRSYALRAEVVAKRAAEKARIERLVDAVFPRRE